MKKMLIYLLFATSVAFAQDEDHDVILNVNAPVLRLEGTNVVQVAPAIPQHWNGIYNYRNWLTQHYRDGWRQATVTTNIVTYTNAIPTVVQQAGAMYQSLMEGLLGPGAHTNTGYEYEDLMPQLVLDTNVSADIGLRLDKLRGILLPYSSGSRVYNFPFGQSNRVLSIPQPVYEQVPE